MAVRNRVFTSFAVEDSYARDFLVGQARNAQTPFEFMDMSVKEPFDESWKSRCRSIIRGCDGVIALLSKNTMAASGARWEMWCARDERIPIIGVHISKDDKGPVPPELAGVPVIEWTWEGIAGFLNRI
jgi:hypothetical protein